MGERVVGYIKGTITNASLEDMERITNYALEHGLSMIEAARQSGFEAKLKELGIKEREGAEIGVQERD